MAPHDPPGDFARRVAEEGRYHRQLERLVARARGHRIEALAHDGVRLSQLLDDRERAVRLLARAVGDGSFRPTSFRVVRAPLAGKEREIAHASAIDLLANAVVAEVLAEIVEPELSPRLYSYRRGRSPWQALRWLATTARDHRNAEQDPKRRGLFVLRSDVESYTDSIPTDDGALVWRELGERVGEHRLPMVRALTGASLRQRGVSFGLPTTNVIGNLYLAPLDRALADEGGYARFGDDVLFVHADPERVRNATRELEALLAGRGLRANPKKLRTFYWNGAPRASAAFPEATAAKAIRFLGATVDFDGTVSLAPEKWRTTLRDLGARIRNGARLLREEPREKQAQALARLVNDALDPRSPLSVRYAPLLDDLVSDRAQLRQLDYLVALWIAEAVSGTRGPRAFREVPYRWLRGEGKLFSRVVARNGSPSRPSSR